MNILAIETSSPACSLAIQKGDQIFTSFEMSPQLQTERILPLLEELLMKSEMTLKDIQAIAYGKGPGSFTGIRVAASVTQGIAFPLSIPTIPISTLAALAQTAYMTKGYHHILTAVDAKTKCIYWAAFVINANGSIELVHKEGLYNPLDTTHRQQMFNFDANLRNSKDWVGVGDGWLTYGESLNNSLNCHIQGIDTEIMPTAQALLPLACAKIKDKQYVKAIDALPTYLR